MFISRNKSFYRCFERTTFIKSKKTYIDIVIDKKYIEKIDIIDMLIDYILNTKLTKLKNMSIKKYKRNKNSYIITVPISTKDLKNLKYRLDILNIDIESMINCLFEIYTS